MSTNRVCALLLAGVGCRPTPLESGVGDAGDPGDSGGPTDTAPPDTGPPDTGPPDTGPPDTGEPDGVPLGPLWCAERRVTGEADLPPLVTSDRGLAHRVVQLQADAEWRVRVVFPADGQQLWEEGAPVALTSPPGLGAAL